MSERVPIRHARRDSLWERVRHAGVELKPKSQEFTIRGHHLEFYKQLLDSDDKYGSTNTTLYAGHDTVLFRHSSFAPQYQVDLIGTTAADKKKYVASAATVYENFLSLPDTYPVTLVEAQKDTYCKTCPIKGTHCDLKNVSSYRTNGSKDVLTDEKTYIDNFLYYIDPKKRKVREETVVFSDAPTERARVVYTTLGSVKKFLRAIEIKDFAVQQEEKAS